MNKKLPEISDDLLEKILSDLSIDEKSKDALRAYQLLTRELSKESDRGMALLATAHLDYELEKLLRHKLIGGKNHLKEIFSFNGPVGTFSARIKLAYSIGLLNKDTIDDINILRKIRNEFAHSYHAISFETENIKSLCSNLKLNIKNEGESARLMFRNVVANISGRINGSLSSTEKFKELKVTILEERNANYNKLNAKLKPYFK